MADRSEVFQDAPPNHLQLGYSEQFTGWVWDTVPRKSRKAGDWNKTQSYKVLIAIVVHVQGWVLTYTWLRKKPCSRAGCLFPVSLYSTLDSSRYFILRDTHRRIGVCFETREIAEQFASLVTKLTNSRPNRLDFADVPHSAASPALIEEIKGLKTKVSLLQNELAQVSQARSHMEGQRLETVESIVELESLSSRLKSSLQRVMKEIATRESEEDSKRLCIICVDRDRSIVFTPCGHFCCCVECSGSFDECPICRGQIQHKQKLYQS